MTYLSPHFTLEELTHSQTAARLGLDNDPPPEVRERLQRTALGLEAVRILLGGAPILISSGYRAPEVNAAVGGSRNSQHMRGEAVDFTAPRFGTPRQIVDAIAESQVPFDQVILEFPGARSGGWVHISFSDKPRHHALIIDRTGTRPLMA